MADQVQLLLQTQVHSGFTMFRIGISGTGYSILKVGSVQYADGRDFRRRTGFRYASRCPSFHEFVILPNITQKYLEIILRLFNILQQAVNRLHFWLRRCKQSRKSLKQTFEDFSKIIRIGGDFTT